MEYERAKDVSDVLIDGKHALMKRQRSYAGRLDRNETTAMLRRMQRIGIRTVDLLVTMSTNRPSMPNPTGNPIIEFGVTLSGEESSSLT